VEANRLRGGQLSLRDERLDLVRDRAPSCDFASQSSSRGTLRLLRSSRYALTRPDRYAAGASRSSGNLTASPQVHFAPAHVVGGLDDRGDVRLARAFAERQAADDGHSYPIFVSSTCLFRRKERKVRKDLTERPT